MKENDLVMFEIKDQETGYGTIVSIEGDSVIVKLFPIPNIEDRFAHPNINEVKVLRAW